METRRLGGEDEELQAPTDGVILCCSQSPAIPTIECSVFFTGLRKKRGARQSHFYGCFARDMGRSGGFSRVGIFLLCQEGRGIAPERFIAFWGRQ